MRTIVSAFQRLSIALCVCAPAFSQSSVTQDGATPSGETPASVACVYKLVSQVPGCPIKGTSAVPTGGSNVIVIVDPYHYPTAETDLGVFSSTFGLPPCTTANSCLTVENVSGQPLENCTVTIESAVDIEWAHAMAPNARIYLVEAESLLLDDLLAGVKKANSIVAHSPGKQGEVSMSWSQNEVATETTLDGQNFVQIGAVYFAASGDQTGGVVKWPSASPLVVSVGGTIFRRDTNGDFSDEAGWSQSGGGPSAYEARPSYQGSISSIVGSQRGTPDVSAIASNVSFYDSQLCGGKSGWLLGQGTSIGAPIWAGIVNSAGVFYSSNTGQLSLFYSNLGNPSIFTDITVGGNGGYPAQPGWDFASGIGTPVGYSGK